MCIRDRYVDGPEGNATNDAFESLHKSFATLSQKDQRTAMLIIHDLQTGDLRPDEDKSITDYIAEYQLREIHGLALILSEATGLNSSQLDHLLKADVTEENLDDFGRFENLKLTANGEKVKSFLKRVLGTEVSPRMTMARFGKLLRAFILDGIARVNIIKAYQNDDITYDETATQEQEPELAQELIQPTAQIAPIEVNANVVRQNFKTVLQDTLHDLRRRLCPVDDIINAIYRVCDTASVPNLDGVGEYIKGAINDIFWQTNRLKKAVAYNLLCTKFEAYAKKVYYLMHGHEILSQNEGEGATLKDVIREIPCLRDLRTNPQSKFRQIYQYLEKLRISRNAESHISPAATDEELEKSTKEIVTVYAFLTASCISQLPSGASYPESDEENGMSMAAEDDA